MLLEPKLCCQGGAWGGALPCVIDSFQLSSNMGDGSLVLSPTLSCFHLVVESLCQSSETEPPLAVAGERKEALKTLEEGSGDGILFSRDIDNDTM